MRPFQSGGFQPRQLNGFADSFGEFMGNLGNSWQGGSDAPMYGGNPNGLPYSTTTGAYNAGQATVQAAGAAADLVLNPVLNYGRGLLRNGGIIIGAGIILVALLNARED